MCVINAPAQRDGDHTVRLEKRFIPRLFSFYRKLVITHKSHKSLLTYEKVTETGI